MTKSHIVVHHSATPDNLVLRDFDAIRRYHMSKGWRNIGYHWVVEYVNNVLQAIQGRQEWETGAHCIPRNHDSIGICVVGNFDVEKPSDKLYRFTADLCRRIMNRHPIELVSDHRRWDATACPGRNFDMSILLKYILESEVIPMPTIKIIVKGKEIDGKLIGDKTYVPLRELVDTLNNEIIWDSKANTVIIK